MKYIFLSLALALLALSRLQAQDTHYILTPLQSLTVPVTVNKITTLVFPVTIGPSVKVSSGISAQKTKGVDNVIQLQATEKNFATTNLTVFGMDGRLYAFDLVYADSPAVLNYRVRDISNTRSGNEINLTGLPVPKTTLQNDADSLCTLHSFLHVHRTIERMHIQLKGVYSKDSLLWLVFSLRNGTGVPYHPEYLRFYIQDKKHVKRSAFQQVEMTPLIETLPNPVEGKKFFAAGFPLFTVAKDKQLLVELAESNGGRLIRLYIKPGTILKAR